MQHPGDQNRLLPEAGAEQGIECDGVVTALEMLRTAVALYGEDSRLLAANPRFVSRMNAIRRMKAGGEAQAGSCHDSESATAEIDTAPLIQCPCPGLASCAGHCTRSMVLGKEVVDVQVRRRPDDTYLVAIPDSSACQTRVTAALNATTALSRQTLIPALVRGESRRVSRTTEDQQAKQQRCALYESEHRLMDFARSTSDWFWEMGPDLRFTWFSAGYQSRTGTDSKRLIGKRREELRHSDDDTDQWQAHLDDLNARRPFRDFVYQIDTGSGNETHIRVSGVPVFDEKGSFFGYRGSGRDITREVQNEKAAEQSRARLIDAIESMSDGFALFDADDRLVMCNSTYRHALVDIADILKPNVTFEILLSALVDRGLIQPAHGSSSREWLRDVLVERRYGMSHRAVVTNLGRWLEIREYPTREGGRVIIRRDVTDRHNAEEAIRRSEATLTRAQRLAHLGSWEYFVGQETMWWSEEVYQITGWTKEQKRPSIRAYLDIVHPDDRARVADALSKAISSPEPYCVGNRLIRTDGSVRFVIQEAEVICDPSGTPAKMIGILQDITERKVQEQALREVEERNRLAFEICPDALCISRLYDGCIIDVNEGFTTLFGYSRDEAIGRTSTELKMWCNLSSRAQLMERLNREGSITDYRTTMISKRGSTLEVLISTRLCMINGEQHIITSLKDISSLLRAEHERRLLSQAVEQSSAAVIVTNDKGIIEYVNPKFTEITGYSRTEAIGQNPRMLKSGSRDDKAYTEMWTKILRGEEWHGEFCNRRKDGTLFWTQASISGVRWEDGKIKHLVGVQNDITARKLAEDRLRSSEERFRSLVDSSVLGIVIDRDGTPLFVNKTFATIFGYDDPEQILALGNLDKLYAMSDLVRIRRYREARAEGRAAPQEYEFRGIKRDGSVIWAQVQVKTVPWLDGPAIQSTVVDITLRKVYEERLHYQANFDPVTELPNRALAVDRLTTAISVARRRTERVGVIFIDVDHFKKINDTMGHAVGDKFLRQAGQRIRHSVRETDTVARLGGDEFLVILPEIRDCTDIEAVGKKIMTAFNDSFSLDGQEAFVSVSVGVAAFPDDGDNADQLMRNADAAMYLAKEEGRGAVRFYTQELSERWHARLKVEGELRRALERDELRLVFQPLIEIRSNRVIGAEALLRWNSPVLGAVPPDQFVRIAEETGLIVPMGEWVLESACEQARRWRDCGLDSIRVSVNVSSRQFRGQSLISAVRRSLRANDLEPDHLELEITESLLMDDLNETKITVDALECFGVRLAVDDFGTGYSSLSYLTRFPLDTLKIDRTFTNTVCSDTAQAALVDGMIVMAHRLGLKVTAEGVETREQLEALRLHGCDVAQGYYLSRPLGPDDFIAFSLDWNRAKAKAS